MPGPMGTAFSDLSMGMGDQLPGQLEQQMAEQRKKRLQQQTQMQSTGGSGAPLMGAFMSLTGNQY